MTLEEAAAWFEGGVRMETAHQAGEAFALAAKVARAFPKMLEALEKVESVHQRLVADALRAAREAVKP